MLQSIYQQLDTKNARINSLRKAMPPIRARSSNTRSDTPTFESIVISIPDRIPVDSQFKLLNNNEPNLPAVCFSGKLITAYAKMVDLTPIYEEALVLHREKNDLYNQAISEYEEVIAVKDQQASVWKELANTYDDQIENYQELNDAQREKPFKKFLRRFAFPAGLGVGVLTGVLIAQVD